MRRHKRGDGATREVAVQPERHRHNKRGTGAAREVTMYHRTNMVGGGDINDVESSGPSRLAATAEASRRLASGDVEAGAIFESGSYCLVGL